MLVESDLHDRVIDFQRVGCVFIFATFFEQGTRAIDRRARLSHIPYAGPDEILEILSFGSLEKNRTGLIRPFASERNTGFETDRGTPLAAQRTQ